MTSWDEQKKLWKVDPDCFNTSSPQILCSLPTSLVGSITKTDEMWWFYDPTRHARTHCQPTGLLNQRKTPATSDGRPCCGTGRISTCFWLLTGRDQHLDSLRLCWITIGWGRRWFNRKINWLRSLTWCPGKIRRTKSSPNQYLKHLPLYQRSLLLSCLFIVHS